MAKFTKKKFPNKHINEAIYLRKLNDNNTFIQKIICSFYDYDSLYLGSKYYNGFINNYLNYSWNENQIRFFSACLIQSFLKLREEKLIHRDVYFDNLVLDEKRYINLIDFHIAMEYSYKDDPKGNFIGSPYLCAPEMIQGLKYDYNSDYYRLGGMLYYIIFKEYPNDIKINKNITDIRISFKKVNNLSFSCIDFINKLIITNSTKRIGYNDISELKSHEFFKNFNWSKLIKRKLESPFPKIKNNHSGLCQKLEKFKKNIFIRTGLLKNSSFRNIFFSYNYIDKDVIHKIRRIMRKSDN